MNRRSFLQSAFAGVALAGNVSSLAPRFRPHSVNTVLGRADPRGLGRVLMHEHVLVDFVGAEKIAPGRYDSAEVFRTALPYLQKLKSAGCNTLVDCTPAYLGRDPALLRRLAKAAGLTIITNTGLYGAADDKYVPSFAYQETAEQLAARWIAEFRSGIAGTDIRPGIIKIGVDSGPLSEIDAKLVEAAALTHRQTGLAIASHTGDGEAAMAQLDLLKKHDVNPSAFIWVHAQNEKDRNLHRRAAEMGAWVEFDGISTSTMDAHADLVLAMLHHGLLNHTLVSQDAGWYHVGEPGGGSFRGYELLFTKFLPRLTAAGLKESEIHALISQNPQRALSQPDWA
jgi:predicted metal-dependent phosphotriesterase family hydrolase